MRKKNKLLSTLLLVIIFSIGLVACSSQDTSETPTTGGDEEETLSGDVTLWTASLSGEPFDSYFDDVKEEFEDLHPEVNIVIEDIPQDEIQQKVLTSLTGDEVPDVVNLAPRFMEKIADQGGLLELGNFLSDEEKEKYLERPLDSGYLNDKLYALPWYVTTTVSFYNGESFDAAGVSETPTTQKELYETAKKVTDATGKPAFYQLIAGGENIMNKMASIANEDLLVEEGKSILQDNEKIIEFFELSQKMYEEGIMPQENAEGSFKTGQELFMAGNVALLETGVTFLGPIEDAAPEIYEKTKIGSPLKKEDAPQNAAIMNLVVPSKTKNPDAAVEFTKFLSNDENQLNFSKAAETVLPSTKEALEDPYFKDPGESPVEQARYESSLAIKSAEKLFPEYERIEGRELREIVKNAYVENLQGSVTPEEALDEIAEKWDKVFEEADEMITF
ncbi:MAG: sugar ABC transporter substrate-binding protein [Atopostipes sp.]|nr:sugar ABC transporter substrate-binding protein [Atopostipes sp.]